MSATSRLAGAVPATLLVWGVTTALALPVAAASETALSAAVARLPRAEQALFEPGSTVLIEAFERATERAGLEVVLAALIAGLATALTAPLLLMLWLSALERRRSLRSAASRGARLYVRSVAVTLLLGVAALLPIVVLGALPVVGHLLLADAPDVRMHDLTLLVLAVPLGLGALWLATVHDLARSTLVAVDPHPLRALLHAVRRAHPSAVAAYASWLALGLLVGLLGHLLGRLLDGTGWWQPLLVVLATQTCALLRFAARGRWLAGAIERVQ